MVKRTHLEIALFGFLGNTKVFLITPVEETASL
jgi:hypothetical protein